MKTLFRQVPLYRFLQYCNKFELEKIVLDCGAGGNCPPLALFLEFGFKTYGIEVSKSQIEKANLFSKNQGIDLNIMHGNMKNLENEENSKAITKISGFIENKNGLYERFDEVIYNTVYELEKVKKLLKEIGWKKVYFAKSMNLNKAINKPEEKNRVFIVAKK